MKLCVKIVSGITTICTAAAAIFMILAVFVPSWKHVQETEDGHLQKEGLWQSCQGGTFEFTRCTFLDNRNTGMWISIYVIVYPFKSRRLKMRC